MQNDLALNTAIVLFKVAGEMGIQPEDFLEKVEDDACLLHEEDMPKILEVIREAAKHGRSDR